MLDRFINSFPRRPAPTHPQDGAYRQSLARLPDLLTDDMSSNDEDKLHRTFISLAKDYKVSEFICFRCILQYEEAPNPQRGSFIFTTFLASHSGVNFVNFLAAATNLILADINLPDGAWQKSGLGNCNQALVNTFTNPNLFDGLKGPLRTELNSPDKKQWIRRHNFLNYQWGRSWDSQTGAAPYTQRDRRTFFDLVLDAQDRLHQATFDPVAMGVWPVVIPLMDFTPKF